MSLSIEAQIEQSLLKALQGAVGRIAFDDSQHRVPVVTGQLKRSGRYSDTPNGFMIEYTAPYAQEVHDGLTSQPSVKLYSSMVREHDRKTKNGTVRVKTHRKNYIGMKPQRMAGGHWVVVGKRPMRRRPNPYLQSAIDERIQKVFGSSGGLAQYMPRSIRVDSID
tara:strand:- start:1001 stop:1495 length:495 start_codon:yes stop_codon:yes gene_type:complete